MLFNIITATCNNNGIGKNNSLPWPYNNSDMKLFYKLTVGNKNNAIIMGKNTFLSINKTLSNRVNIVISNTLNENDYPDVIIFKNILDCIKYCEFKNFDIVWVIGGEYIYKQFLDSNIINYIYETKIYQNYNCDKFFPIIPLKYNIHSIKKINNNPVSILIIWKHNNMFKYHNMDYLL